MATCRNPDSATELRALKDDAKGMLHVVPLDVSSEASIRGSLPLVQAALGENGVIDVLYNNAAIVRTLPPSLGYPQPSILMDV